MKTPAGGLFRMITASGLVCLLLVAGLPSSSAAAESCKGWKTAKFFKSATLQQVSACLSAGEDPNKQNTKGLTALHRAARDTGNPAVIEALLDAGANPRTYNIAGRLPWHFARRNKKIKGSDSYQRLRVESAKKSDWSRVQAVPHDTKTGVRLYQDAASPESRRIKGRFHLATADSITLVIEDGQTRTFPKHAVRKVRTWRPVKKRKPAWVALVIVAVIAEYALHIDLSPTILERLGGHAMITLPIAGGFFYGSRMGSIYDVPPKHRILPQRDQQPGDQGTASGKQEDPRD